MVKGGMTCIKYVLGAFNFVFVIFAILLIVYGAQSLHSTLTIREVIDTPDTSAIACIVIGVILLVIAFLGCCGAFRENHCMLITFSVILLVILVIELILGGLVIAFKNEVKDLASEGLTKTMKKYDHNSTTTNDLVDEMQQKLKCCGVHNYTDWKPWNISIPLSCCPSTHGENATDPCLPEKAFKTGCLESVEDAMRAAYGPLGAVAITVAFIQLLGVLFACCLAYEVKKEYEVV